MRMKATAFIYDTWKNCLPNLAAHAYVLMTNHVHLLLTPQSEDSAALLMKHLGQRYTLTEPAHAVGRPLSLVPDAGRGLCVGLLSLYRA